MYVCLHDAGYVTHQRNMHAYYYCVHYGFLSLQGQCALGYFGKVLYVVYTLMSIFDMCIPYIHRYVTVTRLKNFF